MRKQAELTWDMRAILIDWLSEVADEYKLYSETFHLAVNFIDRFLSRMSVTKSKFQLIGTTALYLAAYENCFLFLMKEKKIDSSFSFF